MEYYIYLLLTFLICASIIVLIAFYNELKTIIKNKDVTLKKTIKEVIEENKPHEITIIKGGKTTLCDQEDTIDFLKEYKHLLNEKVIDYEMTIERFIYIRLK